MQGNGDEIDRVKNELLVSDMLLFFSEKILRGGVIE
jgi:hypothetical protein